MPNYQYICVECRKRFEVYLTYDEFGTHPVDCPNCNSQNVQRLIGRVRFARSEESRLEDMADPSAMAGLEDDPQAMAKFTAAAGDKVEIVADDFICTSADRIKSAAAMQACNTALIKPNQAGTLTESKAALDAARDAGWESIV